MPRQADSRGISASLARPAPSDQLAFCQFNYMHGRHEQANDRFARFQAQSAAYTVTRPASRPVACRPPPPPPPLSRIGICRPARSSDRRDEHDGSARRFNPSGSHSARNEIDDHNDLWPTACSANRVNSAQPTQPALIRHSTLANPDLNCATRRHRNGPRSTSFSSSSSAERAICFAAFESDRHGTKEERTSRKCLRETCHLSPWCRVKLVIVSLPVRSAWSIKLQDDFRSARLCATGRLGRGKR